MYFSAIANWILSSQQLTIYSRAPNLSERNVCAGVEYLLSDKTRWTVSINPPALKMTMNIISFYTIF